MIILDGKFLSAEIKNEVKQKVAKMQEPPLLACVIVEGNEASEIYVSKKQNACAECGIKSMVVRLKENVSQKELENKLEELNNNANVTGILLQLPLPNGLNQNSALNKISASKDVDCLTYENLGKLFAGYNQIAPCTASGIIKLLEKYKVELQGKLVVVVGRSLLVGKSVFSLLEKKNATVILTHSKTQNLKSLTKQADILIVAIGKANYINAEYVKDGAIVVDVGINRVGGKMVGDVDFNSVKPICSMITPVPGGVGPLTVASLMENSFILASNSKKY